MLNYTKTLGALTTGEVFRDARMYPYRTNRHNHQPRRPRMRYPETWRNQSFDDNWYNRSPRPQIVLGPFAATLLFGLILALWIWGDKFL